MDSQPQDLRMAEGDLYSMRNLICKQPHSFVMQQTDLPVPKEGEALIRIRTIGVCGTDYHAFRGKQPYFSYPRILGHEIAGEIAGLEQAPASGLEIGDQVTIMPYLSCGQCIACRSAKPNACVSLEVLGVHADGAMREYMTVPVDYIVKTEGMTWNQIAIIEPLSIGLHAVNRAGITSGEQVLVIGAGPIGLAVMKFAKLAGATVIAMDTNKMRLKYCEEWAKVDKVIEASEHAVEDLALATDGAYPTVVIDATGNAQSMASTFGYAAHGGRIVYVSLVQADIFFSDPEFHKKELTLLGSRAATREEFQFVIQGLKSGSIDADSYITHRAPFDGAIDAFGNWMNPDSGVIKAVIEL